MKAAFMKGNYGPGDVRRLVPNGVIVSVQVFIGYIETNPLWHVLNGFFIFGGLGAISMSLARGLHHTASESTLFHTPYVSPNRHHLLVTGFQQTAPLFYPSFTRRLRQSQAVLGLPSQAMQRRALFRTGQEQL
jgi:hypothetical protein